MNLAFNKLYVVDPFLVIKTSHITKVMIIKCRCNTCPAVTIKPMTGFALILGKISTCNNTFIVNINTGALFEYKIEHG